MEISRLVNDIILRNGNLMERDIGYDGIDGISVICCATTISLSIECVAFAQKLPFAPNTMMDELSRMKWEGDCSDFANLSWKLGNLLYGSDNDDNDRKKSSSFLLVCFLWQSLSRYGVVESVFFRG